MAVNKNMICKDCKLTMVGHGLNHHDKDKHLPEHIGRCCDCTDEILGMPPKFRRRLKDNTEINNTGGDLYGQENNSC